MPDDYQALLSELGAVDSDGNAVTTTNNTDDNNSNSDANQTATTGPNAQTTDPATGDQGTTATDSNADQGDDAGDNADDNAEDEETQRRNEAFAAMRSENGKYKKFIGQLMKGAGFNGSEEDFIKNLEDASYRQQAQRQGNQVSPEILKRMDTLESQNKSLIDAQNRQTFAANLRALQDTFKLNNNELKEFVNAAIKEQMDLTLPGTNFVNIYKSLFFDKLVDKRIEEERQKWIAQSNKAGNAANPDGKSGKKDPTPTDVNTMAEFESLLQSVPK